MYWITYLALFATISNALEITTKWHIPKNEETNPIQTTSIPVKLQTEPTIQFYEKQTNIADTPQLKLSSFEIMRMALIQAKILARKGHYPGAIKKYEQLISRYPDALDIRSDFIDVLMEFGDYETAEIQIKHLLRHKDYQARGLQMMASLYDRLNLPSWTFPIYEKLLTQHPNNSANWLDYATQRSKIGQWQKALNAYARILENDPKNIYALRSVHYIIQEKRPRLNAQFLQYFGSDNSVRNHQHYSFQYTLTESASFQTLFDRIDIQMPEQIDINPSGINQATMEFHLEISTKIRCIGRIFYFSRLSDDISLFGALRYRLLKNIDFQLSYLGPSPWYEPIQALTNDGSYREFELSVSTQFFENLGINSSMAYRKYALNQMDDYGHRLGIHLDISRRILNKPNTNLIFAFDRGDFSYQTTNRIVPMVTKENTYTLSTYIQDQPFTQLSYFLSAGYRWDTGRSLTGYFVNPGFGWQFTSKFQIDCSYSYSSESTGVVQGSTQTYNVNGKIIF